MSFYLDGLSLLFALLITGIGVLVVAYSSAYLKDHRDLGRFYSYLLAFMSSMLGLVLSDNLITLFVFWELTGFSSYLLIGYDHEREAARKAALQALLVTGLGGLALLAGFLLLGNIGGTFSLSELLNNGVDIRSHPLYIPIFALVAVGAFTKSAQFPFHFWLPNAMEAPAPVSSYLHSATMVKAGIYLLARLSPIMGGTVAWRTTLMVAGAVTMLLGAGLAIKHSDFKRILAYSTISILGVLVLLLGIGEKSAVEAAMTYLIVHAIYKGTLFLVAGIVDHETGIRDVTKLSGLRKAMPITAFAAALAALSMAGLPPLFGFLGKELLYEAIIDAPMAAQILTAVTMITSALMVAVAGMVGLAPFFGSKMETSDSLHEAPPAMWIGPVLLASLGLLIGMMPDFLAGMVISPAVAGVLSQPVDVKLGLIHGLSLQLILSGITFIVGVAAYFGRRPLARAISRLDLGAVLGPERWYYRALDCMNLLARAQTRLLQSGHLHFYLLIVILTTVCLVGLSLLTQTPALGVNLTNINSYELLIGLVILAATVAVVRARSRFAAIVALGAVGYSVSLIFIMYGAPDLAMTQFSIDTLTVVLLVLVLHRMPRYAKYSKRYERLRDGLAALLAGGIVTVLVLEATTALADSRLSPYFAENSYALGKGHNIVNVILVDFRALDTMGEITVLGVAAIGVYSLLKLSVGDEKKS
jgi:multicomponent Na+:H+ antiporter subunit A